MSSFTTRKEVQTLMTTKKENVFYQNRIKVHTCLRVQKQRKETNMSLICLSFCILFAASAPATTTLGQPHVMIQTFIIFSLIKKLYQ